MKLLGKLVMLLLAAGAVIFGLAAPPDVPAAAGPRPPSPLLSR